MLHFDALDEDDDGSESPTDGDRALEEPLDLVGVRRRRHVDVAGLAADREIAHGAADDPAALSGGRESRRDSARGARERSGKALHRRSAEH